MLTGIFHGLLLLQKKLVWKILLSSPIKRTKISVREHARKFAIKKRGGAGNVAELAEIKRR